MTELDEVATLINELLIVYPYRQRELSPRELAKLKILYLNSLCNVPIDELKIAVEEHKRHSNYFPTIADLLESAYELHTQARNVLDVDQAWIMACEYARDLYERATLNSQQSINALPEVKEAVKNIGYERIRNRLTQEEGILYAQFRDIYEAICKRAEDRWKQHPQTAEYIHKLASNTVEIPQVAAPAHVDEKISPHVETPSQSKQRVESDMAARKINYQKLKQPTTLGTDAMDFLKRTLHG